jgi:tetratricopeptide (TPR) repeat protein
MRPWSWYRKIQRRSRRKEVLARFLTEMGNDEQTLSRWLDERLSAGERHEVETLLRELPEPSKLPLETYAGLIEACYRAKLFERGLRLATVWQAREPESPAPLNQAARLHSLAGRFEQAHELHRLALKKEEGRAESWYQLGCSHLREDQLDAAEAAFREAMRLEPRLGKAYSNLGFVLDRRGESGPAIQQFKRAIQLDPENAAAHLNLGALYGEQGELDLAIKLFRKALVLSPDSIEGRIGLGMAFYNGNRYGEAIAEFSHVLAQAPQHAGALFHTGVCQGRLGARRKALSTLRRVEMGGSGEHRVQYQMGLCLLNMDAYDRALPHLLAAWKQQPKDPRCAYHLGIVYDKLGRPELARDYYQRAEHLSKGRSLVRAAAN